MFLPLSRLHFTKQLSFARIGSVVKREVSDGGCFVELRTKRGTCAGVADRSASEKSPL
jgi:hypothetical protein